MIDDILKQHKKGDKPRFFLHDEMVEWLKDNLEIDLMIVPRYLYNNEFYQKLGIGNNIHSGFEIQAQLLINGTPVSPKQILYKDTPEVLEKMIYYIEQVMINSTRLEQKIIELEQKINNGK